ncbi:hypothetical protein C8Q80DRAFT_619966 [Daedaleopsis nitida]|nr:hypothetical protein C8Q80DRAFT_619966 [Daedaleopsis nitida]
MMTVSVRGFTLLCMLAPTWLSYVIKIELGQENRTELNRAHFGTNYRTTHESPLAAGIMYYSSEQRFFGILICIGTPRVSLNHSAWTVGNG